MKWLDDMMDRGDDRGPMNLPKTVRRMRRLYIASAIVSTVAVTLGVITETWFLVGAMGPLLSVSALLSLRTHAWFDWLERQRVRRLARAREKMIGDR